MKRVLAVAFFLALVGITFGDPVVRHAKVSTKPASSDPSLIGGPDWNADHVIDPVGLLNLQGIRVVSADPNGSSGTAGQLAWDKTNAQLWINTNGGTTWVAFVRSDGGTSPQQTAFAFLGDSNDLNMGATTDDAVAWNHVVVSGSKVPNTKAVLNSIYATASSEPLTLVDHGTTDLQAENVSTFPGFGYELSFGDAMFDLVNGFGVAPTAQNKLWLAKFGISGVELKQLMPGSAYGQSTPGFGGLNAYNAFKTRLLAFLAASGRRLGGIVITAGGNDGTNSTDAANVAANMVALVAQLRVDFGPQLSVVWVLLNANADIGAVPFKSTVRAQMQLGVSLIANCKLVVIDSYPMASDFLHYRANAVWDMGLQIAETMRRLRGIPARTTALPAIRGYGTPDFNATTLSPRGYPLSIHGDVEYLVVAAMKNLGLSPGIPTPSGWTLRQSLSQTISSQTQRAALFSRNLTQTDLDANDGLPPTVSITPGGDENYAFRFTTFSKSLFPPLDGSVVSYAATTFSAGSVTAGGPTTTAPNDLVITVVVGQGGGLSLTEHFIASDATTNPALFIEAPLGMDSTNFGLVGLFYGQKTLAGAVGNRTVSPNFTTNPSGFTFAVED